MNHSENTHQELLARIPSVTGRDLPAWLAALDDGPSLLRFDERVNWLRSEHQLSHGYASAIVHEQDRRRSQRGFE